MNKILEYMALGKPIVQFELREGRRSAQGASLYATPSDEVEFSQKILDLLDDADKRDSMGKIGLTRMETMLEWRHQAPKLLSAYNTLSGASSGREISLAKNSVSTSSKDQVVAYQSGK